MIIRTDLTNQKFGRLTAIRPHSRRGRITLWLCRCDCGNEHVAGGPYLKNGHTKSCGCLKVETAKRLMTKHGGSVNYIKSPEYTIWRSMRDRCSNPKSDQFHNYGGRGINVCQRWIESFAAFMADIGPRPSRLHSIDRIDGNKDYEPGNVRWATSREQSLNKRNNKIVVFQGRSMPLAEAVELCGANYLRTYKRLRRGWSVERALGVSG